MVNLRKNYFNPWGVNYFAPLRGLQSLHMYTLGPPLPDMIAFAGVPGKFHPFKKNAGISTRFWNMFKENMFFNDFPKQWAYGCAYWNMRVII